MSAAGSPNATGIEPKLKAIGDQIEAIAKQLHAEGNLQDGDALYALGDQIEHFCDRMKGNSSKSGTGIGSTHRTSVNMSESTVAPDDVGMHSKL